MKRLMTDFYKAGKRLVMGMYWYWTSYRKYRIYRREQAERAVNLAVGLTLSGALRRQN